MPTDDFAAARSVPVEDPYYPSKGDPGIDTLHYQLDLHWAPASRTLDATATIAFRAMHPSRTFTLDLSRHLRTTSVVLDGVPVHSQQWADHLVVKSGLMRKLSRHTVTIAYSGTPRPAHAPSTRGDMETLGWTTTASGSVWTMQEPFGAFTWYPVNDQPSDKAFYDARIDVPARWVGVFNGQLLSRAKRDGRTITRWHLDSPAASYLVTIAIGSYRQVKMTGPHGLPITYWVPPGQRRYAKALHQLPRYVRYLEARLGRFPFDRIGAVVVPGESAMETQTMMTLGTATFGYSAPSMRATIVHELAHQWYGDTVTPDNWRDLWLNESFAMYLEARWYSTATGNDFDTYWVDYWRATDQQRRNADGPPGAYHPGEFASTCVYYCGALMLEMLRQKIGNKAFDSALRVWVQTHRNSNVNRADYIRFISHRTGLNLKPFITKWLTARKSPVS